MTLLLGKCSMVVGINVALRMTVIDRRQVERKKTGQPKARKKNTWVKR
jgi:ribosomal protein S9